MLVTTLEELTQVRAKLKNAWRRGEAVGFDTEWDAPTIEYRGKHRPDPLRARLVGYSLAFKGERRGYYVPLNHPHQQPQGDEVGAGATTFEFKARKLLKFVSAPGLKVWAHNWKSEIHVLTNEGYDVQCHMLDSELCAWMAGWKLPGKGGLKLKALAAEYLGYKGPDYETMAKGRHASEIPASEMAPYAAQDAVLTMALGLAASRRMDELELWEHYDLERRCIPVTADMERTGVRLDRERLLAAAARCEEEMGRIQVRFRELTTMTVMLPTKVKEQVPCPNCSMTMLEPEEDYAPCTVQGCVGGRLFFKNGKPKMRTVERDAPTLAGADVGNDRQVARWMFDELKWWPTVEYGRDDNSRVDHVTYEHPRNEVSWSVAEEDIRRFTQLPGAPGKAARMRLRFQALRKYASTYTRGLVHLADQSGDGLLHCGYKQDGTGTSRYSSSGPNLQNLPASERQDLPWLKDLPDIRDCFLAPQDDDANDPWVVIVRDLSQIELRLIAHFSNDPALVDAYRTGKDLHAMTQERLGGIPRRNAKIVNFSTAYLISAKSLRTKVCMATNDWEYTEEEAQAAIDGFYAAYPGVRRMQEEFAADAENNRYATTLTGFKEPLPNWSRFGRFGSERKATNTPVQGSAGGLLKAIKVALRERFVRDGVLGTKVRFQGSVHDSVILVARRSYAAEADRLLAACMEWVGRKYKLRVPLASSGGIGTSWANADKK